jgi:hypothetical protein
MKTIITKKENGLKAYNMLLNFGITNILVIKSELGITKLTFIDKEDNFKECKNNSFITFK